MEINFREFLILSQIFIWQFKDMFANTWLLCASLTKPDTRLYYVNYELQTTRCHNQGYLETSSYTMFLEIKLSIV